ncbi:hypothetical protein [Verticiella sediminum]|nr:hypothetical protein [Verticiella sediminum]
MPVVHLPASLTAEAQVSGTPPEGSIPRGVAGLNELLGQAR